MPSTIAHYGRTGKVTRRLASHKITDDHVVGAHVKESGRGHWRRLCDPGYQARVRRRDVAAKHDGKTEGRRSLREVEYRHRAALRVADQTVKGTL